MGNYNSKSETALVYMCKLPNGKAYIGSTVNLDLRIQQHRNAAVRLLNHPDAPNKLNTNKKLYKDILDCGLANLKWEILEENIPTDLRDEKEQYWISQFETCNPEKGYNISRVISKAPKEYGKKVKIALLEKDLTQKELIKLVREDTGLYLDNSYMSNILKGTRHPEKIVLAINKILGIEE